MPLNTEDSGIVPVQGLRQVGFIVEDLESSMESFSRFFGVPRWKIRHFGSGRIRLLDATRDIGEAGDVSYTSALGIGGGDSIRFELIASEGGGTPFDRWLRSNGEGPFCITTAHVSGNSGGNERMMEDSHPSIEFQWSIKLDGTLRLNYQKMSSSVADLWIQTSASESESDFSSLSVDKEVTYEVPPDGDYGLPIGECIHLGVVVRDREEAKKHFTRVFGFERWVEFDFETGETMVDTMYRGQRVNHSFLNAIGRRGSLSFELIEPTSPRSFYHEILEEKGPVLHHLFPTVCSRETFESALKKMSSDDIEIIQSGTVTGVMDYFYLDLRDRIPNLLVEVVCPLSENWLDQMGTKEEATIIAGNS